MYMCSGLSPHTARRGSGSASPHSPPTQRSGIACGLEHVGAAMHLYSVTLQKSSGITAAVYGSFSAPRSHELVVARGKVLDLMRPDDNGKIQSVHASEVFGVIRSLATCRLTGGNRDYIVVGSDSGKIVILEFSADKQSFERVHAETYGKTGVRRIVPGQYVAADPRGRAVMIGAVEKQKLVYILNRDSAARLTISSPLEAHKSNTICFDMIGVDVGFDNPIFASIEVDTEEVENDPDTKEVCPPAPRARTARWPCVPSPQPPAPAARPTAAHAPPPARDAGSPLRRLLPGPLREDPCFLRARPRPQPCRSQVVGRRRPDR